MSDLNDKIREKIIEKTKKYGDNEHAVRAVVSNVNAIASEATSKEREITVEKTENGISVDELVDLAVKEVDALLGTSTPKPTPPPEPEPKPEPTPDPKPDKTPEPEGDFLPSGAKVPDDVPRQEIQTVKVTNPVTLESTADVVEARRRLKAKQQTSSQEDVTEKAIDDIMGEMAKEREDKAKADAVS